MSSDVNDPGARQVTFDEVHAAYVEQARALHEGGVDFFIVETIFDTLNAKAAIKAILDLEDDGLRARCRSGSAEPSPTAPAAPSRVRRSAPSGTACATRGPWPLASTARSGADLMRPHVAELSRLADTLVGAYPNAGLPNAFGEYDETPDQTAAQLGEWARSGIVNIVGGCCGTTPDHIRAIAAAVEGVKPRDMPEPPEASCALSGLEAFELA